MSEAASARRLYVAIGGLMGVMTGLYLRTIVAGASIALTAGFIAAVGSIGALVGWLLVLLQRPAIPAAPPEPPAPPPSAYFKLQSGVFTSEELRTLRVRPVTIPMAPPDAAIRMTLPRFDATRFVAELVADDAPLAHVVDRLRDAATANAGAVELQAEPELTLVSYFSNGPLDAGGLSPFGWTLSFVDGRLGLACTATSSPWGTSLRYLAVLTYAEPVAERWVEPGALIAHLAQAVPSIAAAGPMRLRAHLPDDLLLYVEDPLRIVDFDIRTQTVANAAHVSAPSSPRPARASVAALCAWLRGEAPDDPVLVEVLAEERVADGVRTLQPPALARVAARLGAPDERPVVCTIRDLLAETPAGAPCRLELTHLLAALPDVLAIPALHAEALGPDAETAAVAATLVRDRLAESSGVPDHPLEALTFLDVRAHMGRTEVQVVPLVSSFDPERDLLPPLVALGCEVTRVRRLAGDARVFAGAKLRLWGRATEVLIASTPIPVPCHIAHVIGRDAEVLAASIRVSPAAYALDLIRADIASGQPPRTHRGALYAAALRLDDAELAAHLEKAAGRGLRDHAYRRAVADALAVQTIPSAQRALARLRDELARAGAPQG